MPNIKSAKKRVKVTATKTLKNQMIVSALKTTIKKLEKAISDGDKATAKELYPVAVSKIDQAAAKNRLHPNKAARKKSQLTLKINAMAD